ncbi:MAG TPA: sensor domain-containing diguanylate cyclase [Pyrinomonadaceae bacterium]|nr:sensor domain-containing diguanylate cyclase [Pyrinomonadaceae bacterium]
MHTLYHFLLAQHPKQLNPVRCRESMIAQLHQYLEDVVLENSLTALVIEYLPASKRRSKREIGRLRDLERTSQNCFLMLTQSDGFSALAEDSNKIQVLRRTEDSRLSERFVVIADARFSALLASVHTEPIDAVRSDDQVIWTFEPDIVYSALEYLMARVSAEHPSQGRTLAAAVNGSMPKSTSLQLTLGVTTKLARLLQEQSEREVVINQIAAAIGDSSSLERILQTAANGVGRALEVSCCAIRVSGEMVEKEITKSYLKAEILQGSNDNNWLADLDNISLQLSRGNAPTVIDGDHPQPQSPIAEAIVPLTSSNGSAGFLMVRTADPARVWADNEMMFLHTVADQITVAVQQAHLITQLRQQALTDALTGCYNRRAFELQLERDLHLATRMRQPLALVMMDLDDFKLINDRAGHGVGDNALRILAESLRAELRAVDTAVRFGGDEFAIILPQANIEGAQIVAERLRKRVEQTEVPGYGHITASFGTASFPLHASSGDTLVVAADRALYHSKHAGRNRVSTPTQEGEESLIVETKVNQEFLIQRLPQTARDSGRRHRA